MVIERVILGGCRISLLSRDDLLQLVRDRLAKEGVPLVVASANLDHIHHFGHGAARSDPAKDGDVEWLVTADGMPIVWTAGRMTRSRWDQLAGSDLLPELLQTAQDCRARVGFVGGWPKQHQTLAAVLQQTMPDLDVAGFWSPSRRDLDDASRAGELAEDVAAADVDLLVVGLGKPAQELWLSEHLLASGATVALAFGAAADFLAGHARRAPTAWRRYGLEWLYRLLREPRRLWRRYLIQGPVAMWRLLRWSKRPGP